MERHKCKLCSRKFANGRALGGHMKAHLANLPLPPPKLVTRQQLGGDWTESASSSFHSSSGEETEINREVVEIKNRAPVVLEEDKEDKSLAVYGLRENPKKSFRLADPEFSFAVDAGSVVQDRESETESRNPTRRRSKRVRKSGFGENHNQKQNQKLDVKLKNPSWVIESPTEPEPVSSISDTSPEEDVAMCLMMLSRDAWMRNNVEHDHHQGKDREGSVQMFEEPEEIIKVSKIRGKLRCEICMKLFRSSQALGAHKRICLLNGTELRNNDGSGDNNERVFQCPYCFKVFGSGQALGGHKRSHLMGSATSTAANVAENSGKLYNNLIDLNLPAPMEDDDFSGVSDA